MGSPEFSVASLDELLSSGFNIIAVITAPDKPSGRGQRIRTSPVKDYARENQIPVLQPEKLTNPDFINSLKALNADLFVVVAFRMLPEVVWSMPPLGTINLHASLLPHYRGAAPINWAVINGEKETGVSTFFIEKDMDTGKIILQENVPILETDNAGDVHDKLMETGSRVLAITVELIRVGDPPQKDQEWLADGVITLKPAPKIFKEDCRINWEQPVEKVYNFIRGLSPYPTAWTEMSNSSGKTQMIKIFETIPEPDTTPAKTTLGTTIPAATNPGTIVTDNKSYLKVRVQNGFIHLLSLQLAGKKRMDIADFLRGFPDLDGCKMII